MGQTSYLFERFCWLTFAVPMFWTAIVKPGYFGHLTYWTLLLHLVYFCVDKNSPFSHPAIYVLHGASFCGAMAVFIGYTFISVCGMYRFGSWIAWENEVGRAAGTVTHDRQFIEAAPNKLYEHLWPVFALIIDAKLSEDVLVKAYAKANRTRTMIGGLGLYLAYGMCWEQYSKATKGDKGSALDVYMQPKEFATSAILGKTDLPEDFIFSNFQKVLLIGFAALMYRAYVLPMVGTKNKPKRA
jgi:hypothetical protein